MPLNERERISEIIKEQIDSFEFKRPCIVEEYEQRISKTEYEIISYDQAVNNAISQQILDSESHDFIEDLTEFGMAVHYVDITSRGIHIRPINPNAMHAVMQAVTGGLKHDIEIADEIDSKENIFSINRNQYYPKSYSSKKRMEFVDTIMFHELKTPKKNHTYGWYRKFEKKRF